MHSKKFYLIVLAAIALLCASIDLRASADLPDLTQTTIQDDSEPDVTARVARVSFVTGDAQLRRLGSDEWERVSLNLPIVEGDEITTGSDSRIEIQLDSFTHIRMAENSYLKVSALRPEGVAVSLPQGTGTFRLTQFNKDRSYFEIDAPGTTVAVQSSGRYRVDAGRAGSSEVSVSVTESGDARIYSESSGFTLKSGRVARLSVSGTDAGEWDTGPAETYADEFDSWSLDRDAAIARELTKAGYDKYYDRDIYGAEDLNAYGEWIYTKKYGYVWRPFSSAISSYAAWSPYRYGQWRWVPPYGWTWVNDEPWGWATYHYGRWVFDDGYWIWSPYGAYRSTRSWWSPALVVITAYAGNICWYPLPYNYAYYNFNHHYTVRNGWGRRGGGHTGGGGTGGPTPTPTPVAGGAVPGSGTLATSRNPRPPLGIVPTSGVVSVVDTEFGRRTKANSLLPPLSVANGVLSRTPANSTSAPLLPSLSDVRQRGGRDIVTPTPAIAAPGNNSRTGAAIRRGDTPLDEELRTTRIFGGRRPVTANPVNVVPGSPTARPTGAVDRPPAISRDPIDRNPPETRAPQDRPPRVTPPLQETQRPRNTPRYDPPVQQAPPTSRPRNDPPPQAPPTSRPRNDPPAQLPPPTSRPPAPRQEPPASRPPSPRSEPPAAKPPPKERPEQDKDGA